MKLRDNSIAIFAISVFTSIGSLYRQSLLLSHHDATIKHVLTTPPTSANQPPKSKSDARRRVRGFLPTQASIKQTNRNATNVHQFTRQKRYAYAYLMAGVDVARPSYLGIFYNVLVSAHILQDSQADIVLMVQMSKNSTNHRLTFREEEILTAMNVRIYYLSDIPERQSFYTMQFDKFRILEMTEYSRVLYMDGDVMPFCPMDYLFELSDPPANTAISALKKNVIVAWRIEPSHGGFFMLAPEEGDFEQLQSIIHQREQELLRGKDFSKSRGWGHRITPPDHWRSTSGREGPNATEWDWHGDFADQGLLYFWTKYYKKEVSLIIGNEVENWTGNTSRTLEESLFPHGCVPREHTKRNCYADSGWKRMVPYRDFRHFTGRAKPWTASGSINMTNTLRFDDVQTAQEYWFFLFRKIRTQLRLQVDPNNLHRNIPPTDFGGWPTIGMARETARSKVASFSSK